MCISHESLLLKQDAEKILQLRSRFVQILNVPQRVRLGPSLAAALLEGLFEHPAPCTMKLPAATYEVCGEGESNRTGSRSSYSIIAKDRVKENGANAL
jgi:hypothetical protein